MATGRCSVWLMPCTRARPCGSPTPPGSFIINFSPYDSYERTAMPCSACNLMQAGEAGPSCTCIRSPHLTAVTARDGGGAAGEGIRPASGSGMQRQTVAPRAASLRQRCAVIPSNERLQVAAALLSDADAEASLSNPSPIADDASASSVATADDDVREGANSTALHVAGLSRAQAARASGLKVPKSTERWVVVGLWLASRDFPQLPFFMPFVNPATGQRLELEVPYKSLMATLSPAYTNRESILLHVRVVQRTGADGRLLDGIRYLCTDIATSYHMGDNAFKWISFQSAP